MHLSLSAWDDTPCASDWAAALPASFADVPSWQHCLLSCVCRHRRPMHLSLSAVGDSAWDDTPRASEWAAALPAPDEDAKPAETAGPSQECVTVSPVRPVS